MWVCIGAVIRSASRSRTTAAQDVNEDDMTIDMDDVLQAVADQFGVSVDEIRSQSRTRAVLPARLVAAYMAHTVSGLSARQIGAELGNRDHMTIGMYCRAVARRAQEDKRFRQTLRVLEAKISCPPSTS
jgi:chromosomal replication initiator protein